MQREREHTHWSALMQMHMHFNHLHVPYIKTHSMTRWWSDWIKYNQWNGVLNKSNKWGQHRSVNCRWFCFSNTNKDSSSQWVHYSKKSWLNCDICPSACLSPTLSHSTAAQITIAQGKNSVMRQSVSLYILTAALFGRTNEGRGEGVRSVRLAEMWPEVIPCRYK